jgi:predicted XRE-type DNA-binding protein
MLVKAKLAARIGESIEARGWSQTEAAEVLGLSQPKLSNLLRGHFRGVSEAKMIACLARLGRDVRIVVGKESAKAAIGRVDVVSA